MQLNMFTESKSLFDVNTKCFNTEEKWLVIDIKSIRNAYEVEKYKYHWTDKIRA